VPCPSSWSWSMTGAGGRGFQASEVAQARYYQVLTVLYCTMLVPMTVHPSMAVARPVGEGQAVLCANTCGRSGSMGLLQ
jgi:hypothetical protein